MEDSLDVLCSCAVLLFAAAVWATFALSGALGRNVRGLPGEAERPSGLPRSATRVALFGLAPLTRAAIALGVSAKAVTSFSLALGAAAGLLLASGHFGAAALLFVAASLGDALDGLVARATRTESAAGALFDASADRYEEFFAFGGLAFYFRANDALLVLMLVALVGSFMVSYGSAKAESLRVPVPAGVLRRAERAVCLGLGTTLAPITSALSLRLEGPEWAGIVPIVAAAAVVAVGANVSAVRRLRVVAAAVSPKREPTAEPARIARSAARPSSRGAVDA